jgi:hypothetical protein
MLLVHSTSLTFIHSLAYRFNVKAVELEKIPDHRDQDFEVCHLQVRIITDTIPQARCPFAAKIAAISSFHLIFVLG